MMTYPLANMEVLDDPPFIDMWYVFSHENSHGYQRGSQIFINVGPSVWCLNPYLQTLPNPLFIDYSKFLLLMVKSPIFAARFRSLFFDVFCIFPNRLVRAPWCLSPTSERIQHLPLLCHPRHALEQLTEPLQQSLQVEEKGLLETRILLEFPHLILQVHEF